MTNLPASYDVICASVRDRCPGGPDDADGDLMLVFLDDDLRPLLTLDLDEGTRHLDELFVRYVTSLVRDLRLPAVVAAATRRGGRPGRLDRWLWRELRDQLADGPTTLLDLLVVGSTQWWSAAGVRAAGAA